MGVFVILGHDLFKIVLGCNTYIFIGYFIKNYLESGFDSVLFASGLALLCSGVGFLNKKW